MSLKSAKLEPAQALPGAGSELPNAILLPVPKETVWAGSKGPGGWLGTGNSSWSLLPWGAEHTHPLLVPAPEGPQGRWGEVSRLRSAGSGLPWGPRPGMMPPWAGSCHCPPLGPWEGHTRGACLGKGKRQSGPHILRPRAPTQAKVSGMGGWSGKGAEGMEGGQACGVCIRKPHRTPPPVHLPQPLTVTHSTSVLPVVTVVLAPGP